MQIGKRIKTEREKQGISQRDLAERVGYSPRGLRKIENGNDPRLSSVVTILAALGFEVVVRPVGAQ